MLDSMNDGIRKINQEDQYGLRGRAGFRLAHNDHNKDKQTNTFYVTANILHDFISPKSVAIGVDTLKERYSTTWGEVGIGAQIPTSKQSYLYLDARYERNLDSRDREGYRGTAGYKYTW